MSLVNYDAPLTVTNFMLENAKVRTLTGPFGSGKTTGMAMELMRRAVMEHADGSGIRRTKFVVVRNTAQQLRQSVLEEIRKWFAPAMNFRVTDSTVQFRFNHSSQGRIESDWMLIPLDKPEDQQRLLSLNITGGWVSEFREVPLTLFEALLGRCGRYVPLGVRGNAWHGLIAESNPPDEDSDWYNKLEIETPPNWRCFRQPGGLDKTAENKLNLPPNYYEDLAANNNPDWVDVHVNGNYGKSLSGQAVFRTTFKPDFHVTYNTLHPIPSIPLMLAQDFGRTPATLITQVDNRARLLVLNEMFDLNSGIEKFAVSQLRPHMATHYAGMASFMIGDPSGQHKTQVREESPFDCLKKLGFKIYPAPTNDLDPRLRAVEELLMRQVDGGPALLIDGTACPNLVKALKFHYRYKRKKQTTELDDKPEKTHPWSDLADDLQYASLGSKGNYAAKLIMQSMPRLKKPIASAAGWT